MSSLESAGWTSDDLQGGRPADTEIISAMFLNQY